jgi:hypothetical protein
MKGLAGAGTGRCSVYNSGLVVPVVMTGRCSVYNSGLVVPVMMTGRCIVYNSGLLVPVEETIGSNQQQSEAMLV